MSRAVAWASELPALPHKGRYLLAVGLAALVAFSPQPARAFSDWVARRDEGVVRQGLDYSCGVAALATYISHYWQRPVSEEALLERLVEEGDSWQLPADWQSRGVSWRVLEQLAADRGLQAAALSLPVDLLMSLRVPVLVRLVVRGQAHFSVLRGVDSLGRVQLADPSWGNQVLSRDAFVSLWALEGQRGTIMLFRAANDETFRADPGYFGVRPLPVRLPPPAL